MTLKEKSTRRGITSENFSDNEIAIEIGLMAEEYGKLPTEVVEARPHEHSRMERFRFNEAVFRATSQFKADQHEDVPGDGVASEQDKKQLIQNQENRAKTSAHGSITDQQEAL